MAFDVKVQIPKSVEDKIVALVEQQIEPLIEEMRQTIARVNRIADDYERKVREVAAVFAVDPKRE